MADVGQGNWKLRTRTRMLESSTIQYAGYEEILHTRMVETLRDVLRLIIVGSHHLRLLLFPTDARLLRCALLHPQGLVRGVDSALVA